MSVPEIKTALTFLATHQGLSLACFPIMFIVFRNLKDRGYFFSKAASLLLFSYLNFVFFVPGVLDKSLRDFFSLIILAALSLFALYKVKKEILNFARNRWRLILAGEGLFLAVFVLALLVRMGDPHIFGNTEKFPDYAIFLRLINENSFPPLDSWMSGFDINYYYLGHFTFACLTRLSKVAPEYGVNLSTVLIFTLFFITTFSLIYNIFERVRVALLCAFSACFLSNLDGFIQLFENGISKFDWWRSSRVIDGTINEFPYFAFLLGDLHAHFISLPFFMLFLGVVICDPDPKKPSDTAKAKNIPKALLISLMLGFMLSVNPWYFPLAFVVLFLKEFSSLDAVNPAGIFKSVFYPLCVSAVALIMFSPFILTYRAPLKGMGLLPNELASEPGQFAVMFAFPLIFACAYAYAKLGKKNPKPLLTAVAFMLVIVIPAQIFFNRGVAAFLLFFLAVNFRLIFKEKFSDPLPMLVFLAALVLLGCEFLYIRDNYGRDLLRMNTVFKFHWPMVAVLLAVTPVLFIEAKKHLSRTVSRQIFTLLFIVFSAACLTYAFLGTKQRNFHRYKPPEYRHLSLDGQRFQRTLYPNEYSAVKWIGGNTHLDDIILEATGKPFSYYARFSTFTGRPTVLGWGNHEMVWRKEGHIDTAIRTNDISRIYLSEDKKLTEDLVKKYGIKFIVVGYIERKEYPEGPLKAFAKLYGKAYENPGVTIYRTDLVKSYE